MSEFIGKEAEIIRTTNKYLLGMRGKIVDETRNSFKLLVNKRNFREFKIILKRNNTFLIGNRIVEGNKIMKRSEDRKK